MHRDLSNPHHKISLQTDYHVPYPDAPKLYPQQRLSFFTYPPSSTLSQHILKPLSTSLAPASAKPLHPATFLSRKLRWLTLGSQYDWKTRSYSGKDPTIFPPDIAALVEEIFRDINPFKSESGVVLLYSPKDYMPVHRDVSEECQNGLLSISLGCDGIFVIAKFDNIDTASEAETNEQITQNCKTMVIRVRSGDVVRMSGTMRWAWHAMPKVIPGTAPNFLQKWPAGTGRDVVEERAYGRWKGYMAAKRINLSCRQVWD
jgi:alkylated DNA repair protein alkB family protein 1